MRYKLLASILVNNPSMQGKFGEMKVASIFHPAFFGDEGQIIINDVHINDGCDHQIDHIIILPFGIFVIETKNIKGKILGKNSDAVWNCINHKKVTTIYNPIKQNSTHVQVIKGFLKEDHVYSVIVFSNSNKPKDVVDNVVNLEELKPYVLSFKDQVCFTPEKMEEIKNRLTQNTEM